MTPREKSILWINSTVLFLFSYMVVFFILGLATLISASAFDITSALYYNQAVFFIRSYDWTADSVKGIYSTGPLLALFMGILLFILYSKVVEETGLLKLFVLWMFAHCLVFFFGDMMMGAIFSKGFGYVIMYLYFMDTGKMIITLFALISLGMIGLLMSRYFLFTANTYFPMLSSKQTQSFVVFQYLLPFCTGFIILLLLKLPGITLYEIFLNGTMIILLLPVLLRARVSPDLFFEEEEKKISLNRISLLILPVLLILFRVILGIGIRV